MSPDIGIIADDLTGAADALAPFCAQGYDCELLLVPHGGSSASVTATITHSRALPPHEARAATREAVATVIAQGRKPYLKIDSTMRGPVIDQLRGALDACAEAAPGARAVACPAYPLLGRTVSEGRVYVDGVPLDESVFTADPRNPVSFSSLAELLPGSRHRPVEELNAPPVDEITTVDAVRMEDLEAVVRLALSDPTVLLAGSAGLASAWAEIASLHQSEQRPTAVPSSVLLVASSRHPTTLAQIDYLPDELYSFIDEDSLAGGSAPVTVLAAPTRFQPRDADRVLDALARQAMNFVRSEDVGQLILIGGDGAAAVLGALGAEAISLHGARMPGHAEGVVRGGIADGMSVITRAGGFGTSTTLSELLRLTLNR